MRKLLLLMLLLICSQVFAACTSCTGECVYCDGDQCKNRPLLYDCTEAQGAAAWDTNKCSNGVCYAPDKNKDVCEGVGGAWPSSYGGTLSHAPCCGDDKAAGHGEVEVFVTSDFACMKGVACGDQEGEEVVDSNDNGVFELAADSCSCSSQHFTKRCSDNYMTQQWTGVCVGIHCCGDVLVDKEGVPSCVAAVELELTHLGKTCDDVSDATYTSGKTVKASPDMTRFGCCGATDCWDGAACRNSGYFSGRNYCVGGSWIICGGDSSTWTNVPECRQYEELFCHQSGWSQSEVSCGESCSAGRCGNPDGDDDLECLTAGGNNQNLPQGVSCTISTDCCALSCVSGVCSAAGSCTPANLGASCSVGSRQGICATDYTSGEASGEICCDSNLAETAVMKSGEVRCVLGLSEYEGWTCDNETRNAAAQNGVVRLSPQNESSCCPSGWCLLDSCVASGHAEEDYLCSNGVLQLCSPEKYCNWEYPFYCGVDGWVREEPDTCGEGICVNQQCVTCEANDTASVTGEGDVVGDWLCRSEAFDYCGNETRLTVAGNAEYLCHEYEWYECTNFTNHQFDLPKDDYPVQTNDSQGRAVSSSGVILNYICNHGDWVACEPTAKKRDLSFDLDGYTRNYWCNTDGDWIQCSQDFVYLQDDGLYECGCEDTQRCFDIATGRKGVCTRTSCCTGWTLDGSACYTNQTEACRWRSGRSCDSLSDGVFSATGICAGDLCCMNDGPGGRMVVGSRASYSDTVECVSKARPEDLGKACDMQPDGSFDGFIGYLYNELGCCLKEQDCDFGAFEPEDNATVEPEENETVACGDCDDGDDCTRDYCDNGVCTHDYVCPECGDGVCEGDECETCQDDCTPEECGDGVCDPLEGCSDVDCSCDFNYDAPSSPKFKSTDSKVFTVTVKNYGNFRERFRVALSGEADSKIDDDSFYLDVGEEKDVQVRVITDAPGLYTFDLTITPEHGTAYAQTIELEVTEAVSESVTELPEVKTMVTAIVVVLGLILAVALGRNLFAKKPESAPLQYAPYQPAWQEQMRQQYYYSTSPQQLKEWWDKSAEKIVPETEDKKENAKKEALKKFAESLRKVQEGTKNGRDNQP